MEEEEEEGSYPYMIVMHRDQDEEKKKKKGYIKIIKRIIRQDKMIEKESSNHMLQNIITLYCFVSTIVLNTIPGNINSIFYISF
jgi:hypothetical protein